MIIVVGGGIAGLSLGWRLAMAGAEITVLEADKIGSGASYAAASYLEPRLGKGAMRALEWASVKAWPDFAHELEAISGQSLDYRTDGQIRIAYKENLEKVKADAEQRDTEGWRVDWLEDDALRALEPHLSDEVLGAAFLPDVHWLDGRRLCRALGLAIEKTGGRVHEHSPVEALITIGGNVRGVMVNDEQLTADRVIIAAGMGANNIASLPADIPRCRPVKGVMLGLAMDVENPIVRRLIKRPDGILCPRSDGRLLVGVTHEEGETSRTASDAAIQKLMRSATRAVPAIAGLELIEAAYGIRSFVGDGLLRLGHSAEIEGLYYSLSHAGAGFIRAPAISAELASFVLDRNADCPHIGPFLKR
ncbi:MAG: NAD(P)/FAD-dependent oxidoreductase [Hyphomicrobiales bacterium]